jgi:PAS domain S-box-containing protein
MVPKAFSMGDVRFVHVIARLRASGDRAAAIRGMATDDLIMALAAASPEREPLLVNVMATELQNRARRALAVAEHLGEGVAIVDEGGVVTFLNPVAEMLLGRAAEDVVGLHASEAVGILDRHGEPLSWEGRPTQRALHEGTVTERDDLMLQSHDGRRIPVTVVAAPIWSEGATIGVVVSFRDVTRQRRDEEDLRFHKRLLDAVGEAVVATRPDGTITYWSRSAEAIYGWSAAEALGRNVVDVTPAETSRGAGEAIMRDMRRGQAWSGVFPVRRRDGSSFLARVTNAPVLDDAGRLVAIIGVSRPEGPA